MIKFGPLGDYLILIAFALWYITLPLGLLLLWACLRRKNAGWLRWIAGIGAVPLLFPFVVFLGLTITESIGSEIDNRQHWKNVDAHTVVLTQPETIAGITLSAGDTVLYNIGFDMSKRQQARLADIDWVHLSKPTRLFNVEAMGMEQNTYGQWNIQLARDQVVQGWPCTGNVVVQKDSTFVLGTLATEHIVWGYPAPKGTRIRYEKDYGQLRLEVSDTVLVTIDEKTKKVVVE